jgi:hypothetical protein
MIYLKSYAETLFEIGKMLGLIFLIMAFFINVSGAPFFVYLAIVSSFVGPASMYLYGRSE